MKLFSWNVNGLRACMNKGFEDFINEISPDVLCLQETKLQPGQESFSFEGYNIFWNSSVAKKGYSGTAVLSKNEPLNVIYGIGEDEIDAEGRVITAEFEDFYLVTSYTPNAQPELKRIDFRMSFEDKLREYLSGLKAKKPVLLCGDLNVAHRPIDLKNPKSNIGNAGFSYEERGKLSELLASGFVDSFRYFYPDKTDAYSWWSYRANARENNVGWRIDYFLVSDCACPHIKGAGIMPEIYGSDHCPVWVDTDLT